MIPHWGLNKKISQYQMKTIIYICGFYSFGFALFHIGFWKLFQWKKQVKNLSFANKGILQTLNVQLIWFFVLVGIICFAFPDELMNTNLGKVFLGGNAIFWQSWFVAVVGDHRGPRVSHSRSESKSCYQYRRALVKRR